jgi:hypothetical protein
MTRGICISAVTASAIALGGCGQAGPRSTIVARVGSSAITLSSVEHWIEVIAPGHVVPDPPRYPGCRRARHAGPRSAAECARDYQSLKQRALRFLITSRWLAGEAAERGMLIPAREVRERVAQARKAGAEEGFSFGEEAAATGRSVADVELELRCRLAAQRLRRRVARAVRPVSSADIERFYSHHLSDFEQRERRFFYIAEDLTNLAAAQRLRSEILKGRSIASTSLHESMERRPHQLSSPAIVRAVFTARPGELVGPIEVNRLRYYLIKLKRIVPASTRALAQVAPTISKRLARERTHRAIEAFVWAATAKWIARTDCVASYVVPGCRQFKGRGTQDAFTLDPGAVLG